MDMRGCLFVFLLTLAAGGARADQALTIPAQCPQTGIYKGCLMQRFDDVDSELPSLDHDVPASVELIGSIRGQAPQSYHFEFRATAKTWADDLRPLLPYLGRSARNKPVVLTSAGPIELAEGDLATGINDVYVIDEMQQRVIAEYTFMDDGPVLETETGKAWFRRKGFCVAAASKRPGLLLTDDNVCSDTARSIDLSLALPESYYLPATRSLLSKLKKLIPSIADDGFGPIGAREYGGAGASLRAFRPIGSNLLVVQTVCGDCY